MKNRTKKTTTMSASFVNRVNGEVEWNVSLLHENNKAAAEYRISNWQLCQMRR